MIEFISYLQWFGDLVTFSWFNDLFLNEAFAQYFMWNVLNYTDTRTRSYIDVKFSNFNAMIFLKLKYT